MLSDGVCRRMSKGAIGGPLTGFGSDEDIIVI